MAEPEVRPDLVEFAEDDPWLYQFDDHSGDVIYLHEADCTQILFEPLAEPLRFTFTFGAVSHVDRCLTDADVTFTLDGVHFIDCEHVGAPIGSETGGLRFRSSTCMWSFKQRVSRTKSPADEGLMPHPGPSRER